MLLDNVKATTVCLILACSILTSHAKAKVVKNAPKDVVKNVQKNTDTLLYLKNENDTELAILIKGEALEDHSSNVDQQVIDQRKVGWVSLIIPANTMVELNVPSNEIGEANYIAVSGETNPLTPIGSCYNLKVGTSYMLRFTNNSFGTDCLSEELNGPLAINRERRKVPYKKVAPHSVEKAPYTPERPSETVGQ